MASTWPRRAQDATLTAGVALGGTKIQIGVVREGIVLGQARVATPQTGVAQGVIDAIARPVLEAQQQPSAIGRHSIGTPGEIDIAAGAVFPAANVAGFSVGAAVLACG